MTARLVVRWADGGLEQPIPDDAPAEWLCLQMAKLLAAIDPGRAAGPAVWEVHHPLPDSGVPS